MTPQGTRGYTEKSLQRRYPISSVLIVDDNQRLAISLRRNFELRGYSCAAAADGAEALRLLSSFPARLILLDIRLAGESGLDLLDRLRTHGYDTPVVIITGNATLESAISALKKRVVDYIRKPIDFEELLTICRPYLDTSAPAHTFPPPSSADLLIQTTDPEFRAIISDAAKLALTDIPVLITGESGTGKELLADYIHTRSGRGKRTMFKLNCASVPEPLLESELFGHTRGAFTGAVTAAQGVFEKSHLSSLFLDEIGDMPLSQQAKILRVLQNNEIRRIGSGDIIYVDVRFIAATNKNIEDVLRSGEFRHDLFYRLNAGHLHIPPLRSRPDDILLLAEHFSRSSAARQDTPIKPFASDVLKRFQEYQWPGNVRELRNVIQYAYAVSGSDTIRLADLPRNMNRGGEEQTAEERPVSAGIRSIEEAESDLIRRTLITTRNNKKEAAGILRISRSTLYEKIKKFGLENGVSESSGQT